MGAIPQGVSERVPPSAQCRQLASPLGSRIVTPSIRCQVVLYMTRSQMESSRQRGLSPQLSSEERSVDEGKGSQEAGGSGTPTRLQPTQCPVSGSVHVC